MTGIKDAHFERNGKIYHFKKDMLASANTLNQIHNKFGFEWTSGKDVVNIFISRDLDDSAIYNRLAVLKQKNFLDRSGGRGDYKFRLSTKSKKYLERYDSFLNKDGFLMKALRKPNYAHISKEDIRPLIEKIKAERPDITPNMEFGFVKFFSLEGYKVGAFIV